MVRRQRRIGLPVQITVSKSIVVICHGLQTSGFFSHDLECPRRHKIGNHTIEPGVQIGSATLQQRSPRGVTGIMNWISIDIYDVLDRQFRLEHCVLLSYNPVNFTVSESASRRTSNLHPQSYRRSCWIRLQTTYTKKPRTVGPGLFRNRQGGREGAIPLRGHAGAKPAATGTLCAGLAQHASEPPTPPTRVAGRHRCNQ